MKSPSKQLTYTILLQPEPEGGFTVIVPALPGCVTYGKTLSKAKEMAQDAIEAYLFSMKKHGEPIPDADSFMTSVTVHSPSRTYA